MKTSLNNENEPSVCSFEITFRRCPTMSHSTGHEVKFKMRIESFLTSFFESWIEQCL